MGDSQIASQNYAFVVQQAMNETNNYKKLRLVHTCLHFVELEEPKPFEKFHRKIDALILNNDFMRQLTMNQHIKDNPAMAVEYLGQDMLGGDDNFKYDPKFEDFLNQLNAEMDIYLAQAFKEVTSEGEEIDFSGGVT
jgi:hypothetical protein